MSHNTDYKLKEDNGFVFIEEGQGKPLILLHGLMGGLSNWTDVVKHFSSSYRVILPILPLYDMPLLSTGVKALAVFLEKFINYLDIDKFTIVGNSLGGHVALIYALGNSSKLDSLVLTGSSGLYESALGSSFPRRENYEYIKDRVTYTFYDPAIVTKDMVDEVYATLNNRNKFIKLLAIAKSAIRHNMEKDLRKIEIPVMLIWGKQDKVTPPEVARDFKDLLPNADLVWIDKCGHAAMMERPAEFNNNLEEFLNKLYNKK